MIGAGARARRRTCWPTCTSETAGNPLYALQLVRHLWESELLTVADEQIRFAGGDPDEHLPRSLLEVVWSRVHAARRPRPPRS